MSQVGTIDSNVSVNDILMVRVLATTVSNIRRMFLIPAKFFYAHTASRGIHIAKPVIFLPYYGDQLPDGVLNELNGEFVYIPDLKSLRCSSHHATVVGNYQTKQGESLPQLCPRTVLKTALDFGKNQHNLDVLVGFEVEFQLLRNGQPVDSHLFAEAIGTYHQMAFLDELHKTLAQLDIQVCALHCEGAPGQYEVSTAPDEPLAAVDKLMISREIIQELALKYGLQATLAPSVTAHRGGNGQHVHLSIWRNGENLFPDSSGKHGLGLMAQQFVAGILKHIRSLTALLQPTANSFERLAANVVCGAYACWSLDHRETAIRVCEEPSSAGCGPKYTNVEVKCVDATANPYYAVAAIVRAGLDGIRSELALSEPSGGYHPAGPMLPVDRREALELFCMDSVALQLLGEQNVAAFRKLQLAEIEITQSMTPEDVRRITMEHF